MKPYRLMILLFALLHCSFLHAQNEPDSALLAEARVSIDAGNQEWIQGFETGDPARVAAIFSEDGVMFGSKGRLFKGQDALLNRISQIMAYYGPGIKVTVSTLQVWVDGESAYETGEYAYQYAKDGSQHKDEGTYCTMWRKQADGKWKLVLDIPVK